MIGSDDILLRPICSAAHACTPFVGLGDAVPASPRTAVLVEALLAGIGRAHASTGVFAPLPSPGTARDSLRTPRSAEAEESMPGVGEGAPELPFAAAVALRTWARTWEACRSVRYATCWRRKSTGTSNRWALGRCEYMWQTGLVMSTYILFPVTCR